LQQHRLAILVARVGTGQIATGTETASLGANDDRTRTAHAVERGVHLGDHHVVEGVQLVGPVEHDLGNSVGDLQMHTHVGLPLVLRSACARGTIAQSDWTTVGGVDGIHDMGGMQGFGTVVRDELVFHTAWERRACGLSSATPVEGNIDSFRHAVERLDPAIYLTAGYYGRWLAALEVRLVGVGLITSDEVDLRSAAGSGARPSAVETLAGLAVSGHSDTQRRQLERPPLFQQGAAVLAADVHPLGHTRLPRFVRGKAGHVRIVHPAFVFPDTNAHGLGEDPQYVYAVEFAAGELWGEGDHTVVVDVFEPYLEPA
jgi:nitrile hydratase beta subunit